MIFKSINAGDREVFIKLMDEFYHTDAVLHPLSAETIERCFDDCVSGSPYIEGYIFREGERTAGFALAARGYSTEAGGECVQLEDLYIKPEYRSRGLGGEFVAFLEQKHKKTARRLRLEVEASNERATALYERMGFSELSYKQMIKDIVAD